jgi:glutaredoxin 2
MKLFIKTECPHCGELKSENVTNLEIIEIDKPDYNGLLPGQVPVLQMEDGVQIWDGLAINSIFNEIRKRI